MDNGLMHAEGKMAKEIEARTSRLPSDLFLWGGLGLLAGSFALQLLHQKHMALALGQVAAPILIMGLYNKTVKQHGHDAADPTPSLIKEKVMV